MVGNEAKGEAGTELLCSLQREDEQFEFDMETEVKPTKRLKTGCAFGIYRPKSCLQHKA